MSGQFLPGTAPHLMVANAEKLGGALAEYINRAYEIYEMELVKLH